MPFDYVDNFQVTHPTSQASQASQTSQAGQDTTDEYYRKQTNREHEYSQNSGYQQNIRNDGNPVNTNNYQENYGHTTNNLPVPTNNLPVSTVVHPTIDEYYHGQNNRDPNYPQNNPYPQNVGNDGNSGNANTYQENHSQTINNVPVPTAIHPTIDNYHRGQENQDPNYPQISVYPQNVGNDGNAGNTNTNQENQNQNQNLNINNNPVATSIIQTLLHEFVTSLETTTTRAPFHTHVDQSYPTANWPQTRPTTRTTTTTTTTRRPAPQNQINTNPYNQYGNDVYKRPSSSNSYGGNSFVYPSDTDTLNDRTYEETFVQPSTTRQTTRRPSITSTSTTRRTTTASPSTARTTHRSQVKLDTLFKTRKRF